jgi:Holliday junction resolvase
MREAQLQKRIIEYLKESGCYVFKAVGSPAQARGTPDLLVCHRGRFLALEVKLRGNEPTALQEYEMDKIRLAGGIAELVYRLEDVERLIHDPSIDNRYGAGNSIHVNRSGNSGGNDRV